MDRMELFLIYDFDNFKSMPRVTYDLEHGKENECAMVIQSSKWLLEGGECWPVVTMASSERNATAGGVGGGGTYAAAISAPRVDSNRPLQARKQG